MQRHAHFSLSGLICNEVNQENIVISKIWQQSKVYQREAIKTGFFIEDKVKNQKRHWRINIPARQGKLLRLSRPTMEGNLLLLLCLLGNRNLKKVEDSNDGQEKLRRLSRPPIEGNLLLSVMSLSSSVTSQVSAKSHLSPDHSMKACDQPNQPT